MATPDDLAKGVVTLARVLTVHWCLLSADEQHIALLGSYVLGSDLADEVLRVGEHARGDFRDYRRVVVRWACEIGVCLEVDRHRWKRVTDDPRVRRFGEGFHEQWQRRIAES